MVKQYIVTIVDKQGISVQAMSTPIAVPPDAKFVFTGANPTSAGLALAQQIFADAVSA